MVKLTELTSNQAFVFLKENPSAKLIDIRSSMEFLFIGHPTTAIHLAWMDDPDWDINPHFVEEIILKGRETEHLAGGGPTTESTQAAFEEASAKRLKTQNVYLGDE